MCKRWKISRVWQQIRKLGKWSAGTHARRYSQFNWSVAVAVSIHAAPTSLTVDSWPYHDVDGELVMWCCKKKGIMAVMLTERK